MSATELLAGRYELGERLGVGGMSTVRLALDRRLERHVAVKLLAEHLAADEQFVSRFRREALAAARLVHPNVVQVFDFGLDEPSGRHYIVMEHIRGQSGAELLRERGRLPVDEALDVVIQSCRGLEYAHRNGVVHRDVKPGNLLRSDEGVVKLADFGIAKAMSEESGITQVGSVLGTASYLAPEQARGEEAGPQADLYALGVVTYQLLSGRLPYEASSLTELALKQQREAPAWLHELEPSVPEPLSHAVDRALALEQSERPRTADEFRELLEAGAKGATIEPTSQTRVTRRDDATSATRVAPAGGGASLSPPTAEARVPRPPRPGAGRPSSPPPAARPERRSGATRALGVLVVVLLLVGAGILAFVVSQGGDGGVNLRDVSGEDTRELVQSLKDFVDANTR